MPNLTLSLSETLLVPGESFLVIWMLCHDRGGPPLTPATVELRLDDRLAFPIETADGSRPGGADRPALGGVIRVDRDRLAAAGLVPADFYRLAGNVRISLQAHSGPSTFSQNRLLPVAGTAAPHIQFTSPEAVRVASGGERRTVRWNEPYSCGLRITSSERIRMDPFLTLTEREAFGTEPATLVGTQSVALLSGASQNVVFPIPAKRWQWLVDQVWTSIGPFQKAFDYQVALSGADEFGNPVAGSPPVMTVWVEVPQEKRELAVAAMYTFAVAVGLDISAAIAVEIPIAAAVLIAAAVAAHVTAEGLGSAALDPPSPDPDYATAAKLTLPDACQKLQSFPLKAFGTWLRAACELAARRNHLYAIEAKVLGAVQAADTKHDSARADEYAAELATIAALYQEMAAVVNAAAKELADHGITSERLEGGLAVAQAQALTGNWSKEAQALAKGGIDLDLLARAVANRTPEQLDLRKAMWSATVALGRCIRAMTDDAIRRYVAVRPQYFDRGPHAK